jgi:hypothetical protein
MAKVSKINISIGDNDHQFEAHYSDKLKFHVKNFPQEILLVNGEWSGKIQNHERMVELENSVRALLKEYYERIKSQRKVILYTLIFSQNFKMRQTGIGSYSGDNPKIKIPSPFDGMYTSSDRGKDINGYGLVFDFCVATEITGSQTKYIRQWKSEGGIVEMEKYATRSSKDEVAIDWTPQREAFFENMKEAMTMMAIKFCDFFGKDEKKLLDVMDSGMKLIGS